MTMVKIANVHTREQAGPLIERLQGRTYMDFEVGLSPAGGSFEVWVTTQREDATEAQMQELLVGLLAHEVMRSGMFRDPTPVSLEELTYATAIDSHLCPRDREAIDGMAPGQVVQYPGMDLKARVCAFHVLWNQREAAGEPRFGEG